jgi:hypothetical protein
MFRAAPIRTITGRMLRRTRGKKRCILMVGASISSLALIKRALPRGLMKHLPPRCQVPRFRTWPRVLGAPHKKGRKALFLEAIGPGYLQLGRRALQQKLQSFLCPIAKFVNCAKT